MYICFGFELLKLNFFNAAGPTSLEEYFQKGALLGQKAALNLWNVDTKPIRKNCSRAFEGLSYLDLKI